MAQVKSTLQDILDDIQNMHNLKAMDPPDADASADFDYIKMDMETGVNFKMPSPTIETVMNKLLEIDQKLQHLTELMGTVLEIRAQQLNDTKKGNT